MIVETQRVSPESQSELESDNVSPPMAISSQGASAEANIIFRALVVDLVSKIAIFTLVFVALVLHCFTIVFIWFFRVLAGRFFFTTVFNVFLLIAFIAVLNMIKPLTMTGGSEYKYGQVAQQKAAACNGAYI